MFTKKKDKFMVQLEEMVFNLDRQLNSENGFQYALRFKSLF